MSSLVIRFPTWASTVRALRNSRLAIPLFVSEPLGHQRKHVQRSKSTRGVSSSFANRPPPRHSAAQASQGPLSPGAT